MDKIIIFQDDDEFIAFAINSTPIFSTNDKGISFYDFDYSEDYKQCLANNQQFKIENEQSSIRKRKQLNYRLIVKPISNLI